MVNSQAHPDTPKNHRAPITDDETQASDGKSNTAEDDSNKTKKNIFINDSKNEAADQIGKPEIKK